MVVVFENPVDISGVDLAVCGDFRQSGDVAAMGFDVAAAVLVRVEGLAADGAEGDRGFGDAKNEMFDDGGADAGLVGKFTKAGVDETFEEDKEVFGSGGLDDFAGTRNG